MCLEGRGEYGRTYDASELLGSFRRHAQKLGKVQKPLGHVAVRRLRGPPGRGPPAEPFPTRGQRAEPDHAVRGRINIANTEGLSWWRY